MAHNTKYDDPNIIDKDFSIYNNIIILKKVKSIRQLRRVEVESVKLAFKQAHVYGFELLKDIQCYIASKTKIWLEMQALHHLVKSEQNEAKTWYRYYSENDYAYVGAHKRVEHALEQYKKELWSIMNDANTTNMEKIHITKELHSLTKTHILLLRDLPFTARLKSYFKEPDDSNHNEREYQNAEKVKWNNDKEIIEQKVSERFRKMVDQSALFSSEQKHNMGIISPTDEDGRIDDDVMEEMQKQLDLTPSDILESINDKVYQESIRRLKEIRED